LYDANKPRFGNAGQIRYQLSWYDAIWSLLWNCRADNSPSLTKHLVVCAITVLFSIVLRFNWYYHSECPVNNKYIFIILLTQFYVRAILVVIVGSWIYNYPCNQYLSPLTLWVQIPYRRFNIMW